MSAVSVNERRDKQIQDAVDNRNWKQALQLCDKRIKKGEKNDHLLAWKAHILLCCPDEGRKQQGESESRGLCDRTLPVTDPGALSILEKCLRAIDAGDQSIAKLWMTAARARPQDADLQENWMMVNFDAGDWRQAQSAAMALQKNFPKKRHFYFWAIVANHLASISPRASEIDRKLFGPLAFKMIAKAASEVPADPNELLSPPRAIQTIEELLLLVAIYRQQGYVKEALTILDSPSLGILSTVGKSNWSLVREKLDLLEQAAMWQEEWDYCRMLLENARPRDTEDTTELKTGTLISQGDDWRLWTGIITSSQKLATSSSKQATEKIIHAYIHQGRSSRNSNLALLSFLAKRVEEEPTISERLLSACKIYFERNCARFICYDDLRLYMEHLNESDQEQFRLHIASHIKSIAPMADASEVSRISWLTSEINSLKVDYTLRVSKSGSQDLLEAFVCNCIHLYKLSMCLGLDRVYSDNKPGDDACILAAMGLVLLSKFVHGHYLLRSAQLLEFLLERSKHNYQALITLVRIYIMLGAGSLAIKTYNRLAIKNLQHETLSHVLFTRLATIHPYPAPMTNSSSASRKEKDPVNSLGVALESYKSSARQATVSKRLFLEKGRYNMLLGVLEVEDTIRQSLSKVMWVLERRRMVRLARSSDDDEFSDLLVPFPGLLHDRRDYEAFPDYEASGHRRFVDYLQIGPKPKSRWVGAQIFIDKLFSRLRNDLTLVDDRTEKDLYQFDREPPVDEMTNDELAAFALLCRVNVCYSSLHDTENSLRVPISQAVEDLKQCLDELYQRYTEERGNVTDEFIYLEHKIIVPHGVYLHGVFSFLEACKSVVTFLESMVAKSKKFKNSLSKEQTLALQESLGKFYQTIYKDAMNIKNSWYKFWVNDQLLEILIGEEAGKVDCIGKETSGLIDKTWTERFGAELVESWRDALDGVLKAKIGLP